MIYFLVLIGLFLIFTGQKYKQISACLCVYLITNPGGFTGNLLSKEALGGFFHIDILFLFVFIIVFTGNYKIKSFINNKLARNIFYILLLFSMYKIFVWGLIVPRHSFNNFFRYCLVRERDSIFGFLFIIPAYLFAMRDLKTFLNIIIIFSSIIISLSLLSILFGWDIVKITSVERYLGSGIIRHYLDSYGLLHFLIPASIIVYLGKFRVKNKRILFFGGVLAIVNIIVSLTKGMYLSLVGSVIATVFFTTKILNIQVSKGLWRTVIFFVFFILTLNLTFPKYSNYALMAFEDIFLLVREGETREGGISRMWQIPAFTYHIKQRPLFGTGQGYDQLSKQFDIDQFDATDLPLLAHIMQYGFVGIFIYSIYYFKIYKLIKLIYNRFKRMDKSKIIREYKYEIIFTIASIAYFVGYFARTFNVFIELTRGEDRIEMAIYTGILLACIERIRIKLTSGSNKQCE